MGAEPAGQEAASLRPTFFAALLVFLLLVALERGLATIFLLNFSTEGPNASALLAAFILTGFLFCAVADRFPAPRTVLWGLIVAGACAMVLSQAQSAWLAALASVAFLLLATPVLAQCVAHLGAEFAIAAALGAGAEVAVRTAFDTLPLYANTAGRVVLTVAAIAYAVLGFLSRRETTSSPVRIPDSLGLAPFLFAQALLLAAPAFLSNWRGLPFLAVAYASLAGLALGALFLELRPPHPRLPLVASFLFILGVGDILWFDALPLVSIAFVQASSVWLLHASLAEGRLPSWRRFALRLGIGQAAGLVAAVAIVFAANWAFVPLGSLFRGTSAWLYLLLAFLLPVAQQVSEFEASRRSRA